MKKTKKTVALLMLGLAATFIASAQSSSTRKWGLETELVSPALPTVQIFRVQATRTVTNPKSKFKGDVLIGAYIRPNVKHDIVEKINEYMATVGYRQFFWKGLHLEAKTDIGYAWGTKNLIDGKDYNNLSWFWEAYAGYKLDFVKRDPFNLYLLPQFGIISSVKADIGPRGGKSDTFIAGNITFGVNF